MATSRSTSSPPGVVPQRDCLPSWICNYTCLGVNLDTFPLAASKAMQFGHSLERILHIILLENPAYGHFQINKTDLSDGFYSVDINDNELPKLGVVLPTNTGT